MKKLITLLLIAAIACTFVDDLKEAGLFDERDDVVLKCGMIFLEFSKKL